MIRVLIGVVLHGDSELTLIIMNDKGVISRSFLLLFLLFGLHHVGIAGQLFGGELFIALSKEILIFGQAEPLRECLDVDVDLHLCQLLLYLIHLLQLMQPLLRVTVVPYYLRKASSPLSVLAQRRRRLP